MMSHITDLYFHISHTWKTSFPEIFLTFSWRRPLSYRNQSIDWIFLHSELKKNKPASIYWQGKYNRSKRKNINISRQFEHETQYKRKYFYDAICVSSIKNLRRIVDVNFFTISKMKNFHQTPIASSIFSPFTGIKLALCESKTFFILWPICFHISWSLSCCTNETIYI